jgi:hypothetical protein
MEKTTNAGAPMEFSNIMLLATCAKSKSRTKPALDAPGRFDSVASISMAHP